MSTKLYSFIATSEEELQQQVGIMKFLVRELTYAQHEGIEIQVFRTSKGIRYRVLEAGYGLRNQMWEHPIFFPTCNYDDRSEKRAKEDEPNKAMADEIDNLIHTKQYFIVVILPATNPPPEAEPAPYYLPCSFCNTPMNEVAPGRWHCPGCGEELV